MNKEKIKEFLKLNCHKFLVFLLLAIIIYLIEIPGRETSYYRGLPFYYSCYGSTGMISPNGFAPDCNDIYWVYLILDFFVWYFISCLIIFIYNKLK